VVTATKNPDWKSSLRGDIDNYVKSILDALNGVAWEDDKQIIELTVKKL
jgi:crossover junction endodeoxyribonuclease RusA